MAAINMSLVARSEAAVAEIAKRSNFASREPGVIVVFAIVGAVAILMIALFISKKVRPSYFRTTIPTATDPHPRCPSARPVLFKDTPWEMEREDDGRDMSKTSSNELYMNGRMWTMPLSRSAQRERIWIIYVHDKFFT